VKWHTYLLIAFTIAVLFFVSRGGHDLPPGRIDGDPTPATVLDTRRDTQAVADLSLGGSGTRQILFGDLHVHTTYSIDAFLYALPIFGEGNTAYPPAFACDFARHCSALDFFSINDHAEGLTPERWQATIDTLRSCSERAGDPSNPDLVPFLGWEWTQVGVTPDRHWGHKNVVLRGLDDAEITRRPIAYRPASDNARAPEDWQLALGESAASFIGEDYANFLWWLRRLLAMPVCAQGVPSPLLPDDCLESAETPAELFAKLDEWGLDSLVIPHGLAWGIHAPPGARLDNQLNRAQHDPKRQMLLEVFSGHGNGEEYRPWLDRPQAGEPGEVCAEPTPDFLPCCWRAGEIMRERCGDLAPDQCEARVERARQLAMEAGRSAQHVFPDTSSEDWLDCDECRDCFKPAAVLRSGETAQYGLALSDWSDGGDEPLRFRWGFIGSSDNHRGRSSTGYKQINRSQMSDTRGIPSPALESRIQGLFRDGDVDPRQPQPVTLNPRSFAALFDNERQASFMYPGGLVAVHAEGRHRDAIWAGLKRREVYATSGPRILLWFDLLNGPDGRMPMGSEASMRAAPRFEVRAVGSFVQKPGCPEHAIEGIGGERLQDLCLGECYHPSDARHPLEAIEVVRVRPAMRGEGSDPAVTSVASRIEDPWRRFDCPASADGCVVTFEDEDYPLHGGDAAYYVRAIQVETPAINGENLRVEFDDAGRAVRARPCYGSYKTPEDDDCLAPVGERAWSSPIFVDQPRVSGS
jgi:hypothetical protein